MTQIRWGIIGCGDVTEIKSGPAFNKVPDSQLVAVMRRNEEKAKDYARRHGVGKWYTSARDLIEDPAVNAIYVATPPSSHEAYTMMSLEAGKPVYLEKPMTTDAASALRIAEAVKNKGVALSVAHYRREQPLFRKIKALLHENRIGKVQTVQLNLSLPSKIDPAKPAEIPWRLDPSVSGGGLFHDLAPHQLDLMYYFFGVPMQATGLAANTAGLYQAEDTVSGQILFEKDVLFNGFWSFVAPAYQKTDECLITGSAGTVRFRVFEPAPVVCITAEGEQEYSFEPLAHVQQPMIHAVVRYFLGQGPNPCSAEEGLEVMRLIDAFTKRKAIS
jgi:predicted dehydrogenase